MTWRNNVRPPLRHRSLRCLDWYPVSMRWPSLALAAPIPPPNFLVDDSIGRTHIPLDNLTF